MKKEYVRNKIRKCVNCIDFPKDETQCRTFVNTVTDFRILKHEMPWPTEDV
jgi:hypothetical protein